MRLLDDVPGVLRVSCNVSNDSFDCRTSSRKRKTRTFIVLSCSAATGMISFACVMEHQNSSAMSGGKGSRESTHGETPRKLPHGCLLLAELKGRSSLVLSRSRRVSPPGGGSRAGDRAKGETKHSRMWGFRSDGSGGDGVGTVGEGK